MKIDAFWIPYALSLFCLWRIVRPHESVGEFDITPIFRVLWLVPLSAIWAIYFGILLLLR